MLDKTIFLMDDEGHQFISKVSPDCELFGIVPIRLVLFYYDLRAQHSFSFKKKIVAIFLKLDGWEMSDAIKFINDSKSEKIEEISGKVMDNAFPYLNLTKNEN